MFAGALACLLPVSHAQPQGASFGNASEAFVLRAQARCLEVNEPQLQVDGARVQLHRCDGRPNQAWRQERGRIVSVANGRCLDVHGPDAGFNGARVQTVACSGAPNQQWRLEQGRLLARVDDRCLEAEVADPARPLARVQTWDCRDTPAQRWTVTPLPPPPPPAPAPEPRTRDVEAGPLFSNDEARMKCPAVCAPARWSGRWVTTVPGQMSVCGCEVEEVRPPPPPITRPPHRTPPPGRGAMPGERFAELARQLEREAFPSNALNTLELVAADHRFTVEQTVRLIGIFQFPSDRVRALELAAPRLVDRENAYRLLEAFTFESEKDEARRVLQRLGGR